MDNADSTKVVRRFNQIMRDYREKKTYFVDTLVQLEGLANDVDNLFHEEELQYDEKRTIRNGRT